MRPEVITREQLVAAVRECKITHAYGDRKDAEWIAGLLLDAAGEYAPSTPSAKPGDGHSHLCDDQCPHDSELHAMAVLLPALPMVSRLCHDARERVMDWAKRRACDGLPPF